MSWLEKLLPPPLVQEQSRTERGQTVPEGLWVKCPKCKSSLYGPDLENDLMVCNHCDNHLLFNARKRVQALTDPGTLTEIGTEVRSKDFLNFKDSKKYVDRLETSTKNSEENDAILTFSGMIDAQPVVVAAMVFEFMGGSMGSVVGERFYRAVSLACEKKCAFVCFSASGGARMQEGLTSLMQMAKTNASLLLLEEHGLPFISVLTHPTMGGVSASFAFMGDIVIAEPGATVGFAGQRVIENTVRQELPKGFQKTAFLLEKGAIDREVHRKDMRAELSNMIRLLTACSRL